MTRNDILIIGAGPSGLFAAAELARHGVHARLVEREGRPHREARATAIQPGTLEILESVGLLQPFIESAEHIRRSSIYGPGMSELRSMTYAGIDCRCDFICSLPQYETERILISHLHAQGGSVERGVMATKVTIDGNAVQVELTHADGAIEVVQPGIVIGAGGAHCPTRDSMHESLEGATYQGCFLAADIAMGPPFPRGEAGVVCGPDGLLLLNPLPGGRWIAFLDLDESVESVAAADVIACVETRLSRKHRPTDVAWFSPFRMHRRIVARFADGRRFLIGDAAHLSSPFGGEGLNAGLLDAYHLAWKLALVLRGHARRALLDSYSVERSIADRHILDVSDDIHRSIVEIAAAIRQRRVVQPAMTDPMAAALLRNARAMIDVDYAGSPLVVDHGPAEADDDGPRPGRRYPDWTHLGGPCHHVLIFGPVGDADALSRIARRWSLCLQIVHDPKLNPIRAGLPNGGLVLIRPDGHIGLRLATADAAALAKLDHHLASYLIPNPTDPAQ